MCGVFAVWGSSPQVFVALLIGVMLRVSYSYLPFSPHHLVSLLWLGGRARQEEEAIHLRRRPDAGVAGWPGAEAGGGGAQEAAAGGGGCALVARGREYTRMVASWCRVPASRGPGRVEGAHLRPALHLTSTPRCVCGAAFSDAWWIVLSSKLAALGSPTSDPSSVCARNPTPLLSALHSPGRQALCADRHRGLPRLGAARPRALRGPLCAPGAQAAAGRGGGGGGGPHGALRPGQAGQER